MSDHKVTGVRPENNTKADLVPLGYFLHTLEELQKSATSLENPKYDDGCQSVLIHLEFLLNICDRYPNTVAGVAKSYWRLGMLGGSEMRRRYQPSIGPASKSLRMIYSLD